jgi:hypothetical protein
MFIQRKGIQDYDTNHALIREKIIVKQTKKNNQLKQNSYLNSQIKNELYLKPEVMLIVYQNSNQPDLHLQQNNNAK